MDEDELLMGSHFREGRYGPVFFAMARDTADLLDAHRLDLDAVGAATVLRNAARHAGQQQPANVVSIVGTHHAGGGGHVYVLTEHVPGDLEGIFGYSAPGEKPPLALMRSLLRGVVHGVAQARGLGVGVAALPEMRHVAVDNRGVAKISVPLHDIAAGDGELPAALRTLPERVAAAGEKRETMLRAADAWLLGVLAAQCASGTPGLLVVGDEADEAEAAVARLVEAGEGGSAFERLVPERVVRMLEHEPDWVDFLRRCFTINPEQRPTVAELQDHPLFAPVTSSPESVGMN